TTQPVRQFTASADGRRLWIGTHTPGYPGPGAAGVSLYSLSGAASIALVSGGGQSGLKNTFLSEALRFRAIDGSGNPQVGTVLRFDGVHGLMPILDSWDTPLWHVTDVNGEVSVKWRLSTSSGTDSLVVGVLGAPGVSVVATAQVVLADSVLPPVVVSLGPANNATNLNAGTAVSATFNKAMDSTSVAAKLKLYCGPNPVAGALHSGSGRKSWIFQPALPLVFSARCSLVVQPAVVDSYGLTTADGASSVFTIQAPPALTIANLSPPAGATTTPIVIEGQGFSPIAAQNTVFFNGALATVTSATPVSLVATVPLAATSGPVTVQTGGSTSNALNFVVLEPNASPGGVINNLSASQGVRDVVVTSDGLRAYVTNPTSNSVTALDIPGAKTITNITVGLQPQGLALLPDDSRGYVANTGSNNVSVIDIRPASADYDKVVATIPVGSAPRDIAVSALGPKVVVANSGSNEVSIIDANPGNATFDEVVSTVNVGSGGQSVSIRPDGTQAFVATSGGTLVVIDLATDAVVGTVNLGSGGQSVSIRPDGTVLFVLCQDGTIKIINIAPQDPNQYKVVGTVNVGSGGQSVSIRPDGALLYVTNSDGSSVLTFSITASNVPGAVTISPGPSVVLTLVAAIPVGKNPAGIAVDPSRGAFVLVCNAGDGTVSVIGVPESLPPVTVEFDLDPDWIVLAMLGHWETGYIEPPAPFQAADISLNSIRLNGVVRADSSQGAVVGDHDRDGIPDVRVKFDRKAVALAVPDGDHVPVTVTGSMGNRLFTGTDTIRVVRFDVTAPTAGAVLNGGQPFPVRWDSPCLMKFLWVAVLHSYDWGATWTLDATHLRNTGSYAWAVPDTTADSVLVAIVLVERDDSDGSEVIGVLAVSDPFSIADTPATSVEPLPAVLSFAPIRPNPASGRTRLRFGLPRATDVRLELFDVLGRRISMLASGRQEAGWHDVTWTGRLENGSRIGAGLYFVRLRAEGREFKQRLIWLR
ncbi:MAG TPA: beta-propeller fold lactonase family protein, partial [Terriglobales bacterium]|nr:beta-propeller fold lactonase family protein [Terriglobales bacterium]